MATPIEIQAVQTAMYDSMNSNAEIKANAAPRCLSALNNPETVGKNIDTVRAELEAAGMASDISEITAAFVAYSWSLLTCKGGWSGCTKNGHRIVQAYRKAARPQKADRVIVVKEPTQEPPAVATPTAPAMPTPAPVGRITDPLMYRVAWYMDNGYHVMLTGLAGVGKTYMIEQLAKIRGWNFYIITAPRMASDVCGYVGPHGRVEVPVTKAITDPNGILLIDEIDRSMPEALIQLNSLLANGYMNVPGIGLVYAYEGFRCVATANTTGMGGNTDMVTAKKLDQSTRDRFQFVKVRWNRRVPEGILARKGATPEDAEEIVDFIGDVRRASLTVDGCSGMAPSYRSVGAFWDVAEAFGYDTAFDEVIVRGSVSVDQLNSLVWSLRCDNMYAKLFKDWAARYEAAQTEMAEYRLSTEAAE